MPTTGPCATTRRAALSIVESPAGIAALAAAVEEEGRTFATDFAAASGDLVVSAGALGYRTDDEVLDVLTRMRAAADRGWIVEPVDVPPIDEHDAVHALLTLVGTGTPHRTADDLARLAERAGWMAGARTSLGWDHTLLELRAILNA